MSLIIGIGNDNNLLLMFIKEENTSASIQDCYNISVMNNDDRYSTMEIVKTK